MHVVHGGLAGGSTLSQLRNNSDIAAIISNIKVALAMLETEHSEYNFYNFLCLNVEYFLALLTYN